MDQRHSARVIAFPQPARRPDDDAGERLRRALQALEAAVVAQRGAVAQWRGALGALGSSVGGLHAAMLGYDATLGALRGRVDAVTENARLLERWADAVVAQEK